MRLALHHGDASGRVDGLQGGRVLTDNVLEGVHALGVSLRKLASEDAREHV